MDNAPACPCYDPVGRYLTGQARAFCPQTGGPKNEAVQFDQFVCNHSGGAELALTQCTGTAKVVNEQP